MKEKKIYQRLREEAVLPMRPDSQRLLDALGLSLSERQEMSAPKQKRIWLPVVAVSCTAAIAIVVCVPVYLNLQGQTAIIEPGGQTSSTAEVKRKLVSGFDSDQISMIMFAISYRLQEELDKPENKDALFRVKINCAIQPPEDYLYQEETYEAIEQSMLETLNFFEKQYGVSFDVLDDTKKMWALSGYWEDEFESAEDYLEYLQKDPDYLALQQKTLEHIDKFKACWQQYRSEKIARITAMGVSLEPVLESAHNREEPYYFYANLTREQIDELVEADSSYQFFLALPPRPEGYDRRIADTLAMTLERGDRDTYQVMVYTTICEDISGTYWYNDDLIRELKEEEFTQAFGDNFLADIRKRHGIEKQYLPNYHLHDDGTTHLLEDWYVRQDEYGEWYYGGGYFKAELTKAQILELAQDSDIRAIYLSDTDPDYVAIVEQYPA